MLCCFDMAGWMWSLKSCQATDAIYIQMF
uniref:Uncharacterized protein n=1 Tax=Arundo donax TaxID=35708 RepID=A0A0A9BPZ3_ARUDO